MLNTNFIMSAVEAMKNLRWKEFESSEISDGGPNRYFMYWQIISYALQTYIVMLRKTRLRVDLRWTTWYVSLWDERIHFHRDARLNRYLTPVSQHQRNLLTYCSPKKISFSQCVLFQRPFRLIETCNNEIFSIDEKQVNLIPKINASSR